MLLFSDHTIRSRVYDSAGVNTGPRAGASGFWGVLSMKFLESQERPTNTYLPPRRKSACLDTSHSFLASAFAAFRRRGGHQ